MSKVRNRNLGEAMGNQKKRQVRVLGKWRMMAN
jgi:hypothetical protein